MKSIENNINFIYNEIKNFMKFVLDSILKYSIISWIIFVVTSLFIYTTSPTLFTYLLSYYNLNTNDLSIIEKLMDKVNNQNIEINKIESKLMELLEEKLKLEEEISKAKGQKEGLLESLKYIKKDNWYIIIFTTISITIVVGGICYYLFSDSGSADFFKPIVEHISNSAKNNNEVIAKSSDIITKSIKKLDGDLLIINSKLIDITNAIDVLQKK